ncbi:MAG TPA: hypothetical protein VIM73_11680 [Polyangiaceae bacterium]
MTSLGIWLLVALGAVSCASAPSSGTPAPNSAPSAPPLHRGSLTDYVPAAGLRWMLAGSPRKIAESSVFRDSLRLLLPAERLNAFATGSGADLRLVDTGLVAGFDLGTLYLFTPPEGAQEAIVRRFRERIASGERIARPHPDLLRVSGIVGGIPQTLVRLDGFAVAFASADPTLARIVEAFARKELKSPSSLQGAALSQLGTTPADAVATFYAPGPFEGEWAQGARGLLADAVALQISVTAAGTERIRLDVELAGDFPPHGADDLVHGFRALSESSTGKLLGLDQLESSPNVPEREGRLLMDVELALAPIARGLRAAVIADVWEIFDLPKRPTKP